MFVLELARKERCGGYKGFKVWLHFIVPLCKRSLMIRLHVQSELKISSFVIHDSFDHVNIFTFYWLY